MDNDVLVAWLRAFSAAAALGAASVCAFAAIRNHFCYGRKRYLLYSLAAVLFTVGVELALRVWVRVEAAQGQIVAMDTWPWVAMAAVKTAALVVLLVEVVRQVARRNKGF